VLKQRGARYTLKWKERIGFAKLAFEFGCRIVPFAAIGVEDMLDVVADEDTPILGRASRLTPLRDPQPERPDSSCGRLLEVGADPRDRLVPLCVREQPHLAGH
jgi:hypothetical protein